MPKTIIVTSGPTNEKIDDVMQITNMSTGNLGAKIADVLARRDPKAVIYYISVKLAKKPVSAGDETNPVRLIEVASADDMLREMTRLLTENRVDAVIHTAAVGDYKADYAIRGEDLAKEIASAVMTCSADEEEIAGRVLDVIKNPGTLQDQNSKISSYEPNLIVKLGLTPKIISTIKTTSPDTMLIACKLLDHVSKRRLFDVASALRRKNRADYVIANDLSLIGKGLHPAMIVGPGKTPDEDGIAVECRTKDEIAQTVAGLVYGGMDYVALEPKPAPAADEGWKLR